MEDFLDAAKRKFLYLSRWSTPQKILAAAGFFILLIFSSIVIWGGGEDFVVLDSGSKVIVEEINAEKSLWGKVISQNPASSAMLFASNLENSLSNVFRGTNNGKNVSPLGGPDEISDVNQLETAAGSAVVAQDPVLAIIPASGYFYFDGGDILTYEVEEGDSLASIAGDFGISVATLTSANNIGSKTVLKPGDKISILPVDGVKHTVKSGDTIQTIAVSYKADPYRIIAFNGLDELGLIKPGDVLVIPGGEHVPISTKVAPAKNPAPQTLPNLTGYYGRPANGRITFGLHRFNAVDIGGKDWCNTSLYAAADGTVITSDSQGWNGGYGKYVKISHDNGTITLYAHASQLLVVVGQRVTKGQTIALMGSTGNATGCHVHFEVRGARNPYANY